MTDYMMAKVILAKQEPNVLKQIDILGESQALELVSILAKLDGNYYLTDKSHKECVDAKSFLGVMYFMVVHPHDTYLVYDN